MTTWMNLEKISQTQKGKCCMTSLICEIQKSRNHKSREWHGGLQTEVGLGGGMGDVDGREQRGSQVGESRQLMHSMMPGINTTSTHWNRHRIKYCAKRVSFRYSHHTQKELTM